MKLTVSYDDSAIHRGLERNVETETFDCATWADVFNSIVDFCPLVDGDFAYDIVEKLHLDEDTDWEDISPEDIERYVNECYGGNGAQALESIIDDMDISGGTWIYFLQIDDNIIIDQREEAEEEWSEEDEDEDYDDTNEAAEELYEMIDDKMQNKERVYVLRDDVSRKFLKTATVFDAQTIDLKDAYQYSTREAAAIQARRLDSKGHDIVIEEAIIDNDAHTITLA